MAKKRKKYLVTNNSEAYACSLVTSPAVEETFVAFNEEKPLVEKFADEKKHMVTGVVAIPNKPIYRRTEDGDEYDIVFSAEAIEAMAKDFLKEYRQHEVTLQHQENADGVYLVEQWIKTDAVYDKSIAVGLSRELPVGSWIQTYYVDSNDVWKRIESGELQGFSLECMLGLEEFEKKVEEVKSDNNMNIETNEMFWTKLVNVLKETFSKKDEEVVEEKPHTIESTNIDLEAEPAPAEPVAEPVSEPVSEPEPAPVQEEPKEEPVDHSKGLNGSNADVPEPKNEPEPAPEEPKADTSKLEELIGNLKAEIEALKQSNEGLQEKIKDMGKQPSTNPINTNAKPNAADTYASWREQMAKYL